MAEHGSIADQADRDAATFERTRNVIVDAGAGTGKTTLLVERVLQLVAPTDDATDVLPLQRVAAITFTRRAAGELKLRLRASFLDALSSSTLSTVRRQRLESGVKALDNAHIGTIHSFADRLLRACPVEAKISPDYDIAEDTGVLEAQLLDALLDGATTGELASKLSGAEAVARADEAAATVRDFQRAGLLTTTVELEFYSKLGLDSLVSDILRTRDRPLEEPEAPVADMRAVHRLVDEARAQGDGVTGESVGGRKMRRILDMLAPMMDEQDPTEALRLWVRVKSELSYGSPKAKECKGEEAAWDAFKWIAQGVRGKRDNKEERGTSIVEDIDVQLVGWMAARMVRLRPVVLAIYEDVKASHEAVDQVDLLLKLRDILRDHPRDVRAPLQGRFDHILVDEFQDTDPLQAEIMLYLCEDGVAAKRYQDVTLRPGSITVVGDPKQSIYRFRRADIAVYDEVCELIRRGPTLQAELRVNFRSRGDMLPWLNSAFEGLLGEGADGARFDAATGRVFHRPLDAGREAGEGSSVRVLPYGTGQKLTVDPARELEGAALAGYLQYLVEVERPQIPDARDGSLRPLRYGDIAVLAISTPNLYRLTGPLDQRRVPHVVRGGTLFLKDPLHRQVLLALRALSDREDGVAQAALQRPPFFGVRFRELLEARHGEAGDAVQQARARITALRRERFSRPVAETIRALIEETGLGRFVAAMPNGAQRLAQLDTLARGLATLARNEGLDFDGLTEHARTWLERPGSIEVPLPMDIDAVQILTVHQAKGLEWPVVALWDGCGSTLTFLSQPGFFIDGSSGQWAVALHSLKHDPQGPSVLAQREKLFRSEERRRVTYVAATRARELLIVPEACAVQEKYLYGILLAHGRSEQSERVPEYRPGADADAGAWWEQASGTSLRPPAPVDGAAVEAWPAAATAACQPRLSPTGVSAAAHTLRASLQVQDEEAGEPPRFFRKGRHGATFGSTVHRALELLLTGRAADPVAAVERASAIEGLQEKFELAAQDVERAIEALRGAALLSDGVSLRPEYPLAGVLPNDDGLLLTGYIDLLAHSGDELVVIDFKTDQPPEDGADVMTTHAAYVAQVKAYVSLLESAGVGAPCTVRGALLFTADGVMRSVA